MPNTTLNIRNIDEAAVTKLKRAAAARGMTLGVYVARLADLHEVVREWADGEIRRGMGDKWEEQLTALGLQTITG